MSVGQSVCLLVCLSIITLLFITFFELLGITAPVQSHATVQPCIRPCYVQQNVILSLSYSRLEPFIRYFSLSFNFIHKYRNLMICSNLQQFLIMLQICCIMQQNKNLGVKHCLHPSFTSQISLIYKISGS